MAQFAVVTASRWHCGQIARKLRREQVEGVRSIGLGTHDGIAVAYLMSSERKAWLIDGRLAAVGGLIATLLSPSGVIWLAIAAEDAKRFPKTMFKTAREWLSIFGDGKLNLRITILTSDKPSIRFAERLGFYATGEATEDGALAVMQLDCGAD